MPNGLQDVRGTILDVGAADRWIEPFLSKDAAYVALDYPPTGRELYRATLHVFGDAARLPFHADSFDGAVCLEVLEHVARPMEVLSEIARVMKPGAKAWISMPFLYPLHDAPFDFQRYTEFGLRRGVEESGLQVSRLHKTGHSIASAGLLVCLAIAGGAVSSSAWLRWLLMPMAAVAVLAVNLLAWALSKLWPDWAHMGMGHELEVVKP